MSSSSATSRSRTCTSAPTASSRRTSGRRWRNPTTASAAAVPRRAPTRHAPQLAAGRSGGRQARVARPPRPLDGSEPPPAPCGTQIQRRPAVLLVDGAPVEQVACGTDGLRRAPRAPARRRCCHWTGARAADGFLVTPARLGTARRRRGGDRDRVVAGPLAAGELVPRMVRLVASGARYACVVVALVLGWRLVSFALVLLAALQLALWALSCCAAGHPDRLRTVLARSWRDGRGRRRRGDRHFGSAAGHVRGPVMVPGSSPSPRWSWSPWPA